jgi:branched-chain amino acid transport system substrate-binding protein
MKRLLYGLAAGALVVTACGQNSQTSSSNQPIIIGAAIGQSGILAPYDGPPLIGAEMAVAKVNAAGGVLGRSLKIVYADTHSDVNQGGQAALEVIGKGAQFVIVSCDFDFGAGATRVAVQHGLLAFSTCAGSPKFGPAVLGSLAYTMGTAGETFGAAMAEYSYKTKGFRNAVFFTDTSIDYFKVLCGAAQQRWTELGGIVARSDSFLQGDTSISPEITRIEALPQKPDVIFVCSYAPGGPSALKQFRAAGIKAALFGGDAFDGRTWQSAVPGLTNFNFVSYVSIFGDDGDPAVNQFGKDYESKSGQPLGNGSALTGYGVIEMLAKAAKQANSLKGSDLAKVLDTFTNVPSLVGPTTFTSTVHLNPLRPVTIMAIENGQARFVTRYTPEKVPPLRV